MLTHLLAVIIFSFSCAHTNNNAAPKNTKQSCMDSYSELNDSGLNFVGIAEGYSIDMAKTAAQSDLMKSISVKK